jgi:hypothetical protein
MKSTINHAFSALFRFSAAVELRGNLVTACRWAMGNIRRSGTAWGMSPMVNLKPQRARLNYFVEWCHVVRCEHDNKKHSCSSETVLVAEIDGVEKIWKSFRRVNGHGMLGKPLIMTILNSRK